MSYETPYAGLKVVDLSQGVAGPYCTMLLAQYGADVIKVEPPEGDWSRTLGTPVGGHTAYSIAANLGKRSIVMDLKSEIDKGRLWRLIDSADVFVEGFRPGVIQRLGFDYDRVSVRNPRILYVSISGFGQIGPLAHKPAMDPVLQAFTGFMMANKDAQGKPQRTGPVVVDMATGLYAYQALSTALYAREQLTQGRKIEVSLMQAAANLQVIRMMQTHLLGHQPTGGTAPGGVYECRDGYIQIVVLKQKDFVTVCQILGLERLCKDERFACAMGRTEHAAEIVEQVAEALRTAGSAHWSRLLTEAGIQNERVLDYPEFLSHPQVEASALISWLEQPGMDRPVPLTNPPGAPVLDNGSQPARSPLIGEHTKEILRELNDG